MSTLNELRKEAVVGTALGGLLGSGLGAYQAPEGKKMEGVGSILKKLGAVAVAFVGLMIAKGITKWLQESTRLASIQQDALHDLGAAYRQLGNQDVKRATAEIAAFASELQNASVIGAMSSHS